LNNFYSPVLQALKEKTDIDFSWNVFKKSDFTQIKKILEG